jgi:glycosyltransferase involved in cell wall biosynthesis
MRLVLIADTFPPLRTSGAVQLRDLSRALVRNGHAVTVILPSPDIERHALLETINGIEVLRLRSPRTKDIGNIRRVIGECLMPFIMLRQLRKSELATRTWDGVVWYSPSIFHGPLVSAIKRASKCGSYLILRDMFPEWMVDMGLMGRGIPYRFLKAVARYQYRVADIIGVQTHGNLPYFGDDPKLSSLQVEVLHNWLGPVADKPSTINLQDTPLAGRRVFVYAGNMGIAQGMDVLVDVARQLQSRPDIGFLFVGRGSDAKRLAQKARSLNLDNVLFCDEIDPDEIPALYAQCAVGLLALDPRHRLHNIPGKFLTYMQCGLPVLANVNSNNDIAVLIRGNGVGKVAEDGTVEQLVQMALDMVEDRDWEGVQAKRCRDLFAQLFSVDATADRIVAGLSVLNPAPDGRSA